MIERFALLPTLLFGAAASLWLSFAAAPAVANAQASDTPQTYPTLSAKLAALSPEQLEELFVFVAGNTLFTLYHESGHMLISELELPVLAQEEDAVDNLATVSMLGADTDDMDLYLTQAMIGWFLIAEENYDDLVFYDEHDLDQQRGYKMLCLMVGADEDAFLDFARDLDLPEERIESCAFDYEQASASWESVTDPYLRDSDTPGGKIKVVHDPASRDMGPMALFLKESGLMELVAKEFDTFYDLPRSVTFRAAACGEENAFWDPDKREVILCHELLAGLAEIYLSVPDEDENAQKAD
ncbi:hypothetical protein SIAM614_11338 [Stappia aggregata IAM 12614]|uniref:Metallopeptidase DUF4344 n=1 Tax=Roseibium aggregatum (strain ATCC 25650 / DSM 13394 / JCM 20685 / NBRC 16684 / NCIMB 2208 / IAM 12614 / B1) TaxID=384765 RepID=A0NTF5_ROSAI|nr:DUF4344 domain-containing metallopeptidase [Roseibium aggregatum]EAV43714.1 hypothetical protein SIAM614_11338 [Stappia aggregata IAM 12614] [Roseibium aggregatum IAM 12614]